jgi:hypothetical protein
MAWPADRACAIKRPAASKKIKQNKQLAASKQGCCQGRRVLPLKRSRKGLDRGRRKLIHDGCRSPSAVGRHPQGSFQP